MRFSIGLWNIDNKSKDQDNIKSEMKTKLNLFKIDSSTIFLLVSNIVAILFAVLQNWSLPSIMIVYWAQSVIIGGFNFVRILKLKQFDTKNFYINHKPVEATNKIKYFTAFFFLIHYGIFHLVYLFFLLQFSAVNLFGIFSLVLVVLFFSNHLFSYYYNKDKDSSKKPNIGKIMFFPYARIIPMHIMIVLGITLVHSTSGLILFLGLKTIADLVMHNWEHTI